MDCGECTLCCELLPIAEIDKPHSVLCKDCVLSRGCSIYETRPQSCRDFKCLYNLSEDMDVSLRPNNTHVIFEKITDDIYLCLVDPKFLDAWKSITVQNYIDTLYESGISVFVSSFTNEPKRIKVAPCHTQDYVEKTVMLELKKL